MLAESDHELRSRQLLRPAPASAPAPHSLAAGLAGAAPSPYPVLPGVATPVATPEPPTADAADEERGPRQSVRLKQLWAGMMASLVVSLDGRPPRLSLAQCVSLLCHGSPLGRRWMTALPYDLNSTLSDREVQVGLQLRTLLPAPRGRCQTCGKRAPHGHDDICQLAPFRRIARHNRATKLHENELKRVEDTSVVREPRLIGDAHRTDLRVSGKGAPLGVLTEFDFTIISTASVDASKTVWTTGKRLEREGKGLWLRAQAALTAVLTKKAEAKSKLYLKPLAQRGISFTPMVFSLEGAAHPDAIKTFIHWRSVAPSFSYTFTSFAVSLLRSRAETFALRCYDLY
ncbi:hypothetical protein OC835_007388 [Tilletia horrida]|nr:hypothetical protein OC835_007388 [Tilletia horrida]